eukprot:scaffold23223_cov60-Phaeocystis_antarctica.AAC.3
MAGSAVARRPRRRRGRQAGAGVGGRAAGPRRGGTRAQTSENTRAAGAVGGGGEATIHTGGVDSRLPPVKLRPAHPARDADASACVQPHMLLSLASYHPGDGRILKKKHGKFERRF